VADQCAGELEQAEVDLGAAFVRATVSIGGRPSMGNDHCVALWRRHVTGLSPGPDEPQLAMPLFVLWSPPDTRSGRPRF
jgi:hypothetical protein